MLSAEGEVKNFLKNPLSDIYKFLASEVSNAILQASKNRLLEYQVSEYQNNMYSKTFFHRLDSIRLYDFYHHLTLQKLENPFTVSRESFSTKEIHKIFTKCSRVSIVGTAGSGKSTLVKHLFVDTVKKGLQYPILIELRELNRENYKGDVLKFIYEEVFEFQELAISKCIIERMLSKGGFLFILDGYDEIKSDLVFESKSNINKLVSRFSNNSFLISSRPHSGVENLIGFQNFQVADLDLNEVDSFIEKLIPQKESLKSRILEEIRKPENESYLSFIKNPLLLSLFILTFEAHPKLPSRKISYYEKVFNTLYETHNSVSKTTHSIEIKSGLDEEKIIQVLSVFSFMSYFQGNYEFESDYLKKTLNSIKDSIDLLDFDVSELINDLVKSLCLLNIDGSYYEFAHRSLQEYFVVKYIGGNGRPTQEKICRLIRSDLKSHSHLLELMSEDDLSLFIKEILLKYIDVLVKQNGIFVDYPTEENWDVAHEDFRFFETLLLNRAELKTIYDKFLNECSMSINRKSNLFKKRPDYGIDYQAVIDRILTLDNNFSKLKNALMKAIEKKDTLAEEIFKLAKVKNTK